MAAMRPDNAPGAGNVRNGNTPSHPVVFHYSIRTPEKTK
jgi:hypothetical protein